MQAVGDLDADVAGPGLAACRRFPITSSPREAPSGTRAMTKESEPMTSGAAHVADGDARPVRPGEAFAANLKFAARDSRRRGDSGNLRAAIRNFPKSHNER